MRLFYSEKSKSDFVDQSCGRLTALEVLDIVTSIAKKASFICQTDSYGSGIKEIALFSDIKNNKLIWFVNFELLDENGQSYGSAIDSTLASIHVDDSNGEILTIWQKGSKKALAYAEFLKLLETV